MTEGAVRHFVGFVPPESASAPHSAALRLLKFLLYGALGPCQGSPLSEAAESVCLAKPVSSFNISAAGYVHFAVLVKCRSIGRGMCVVSYTSPISYFITQL